MNAKTLHAATDSTMRYGLVAIGTSLGGLRALRSVLSALPKTFRLPVVIVQHRNPDAGDPLQVVLQETCALDIVEAEDKAPIKAGTVYLSPSNYHLLVEGEHFALSTEDEELFVRPSINVMFETAAESFGPRVVGVVLTGTGHDGAQGLAAIQRAGGLAVVECPDTAQAAEMPRAAADAVTAAVELRLEEIGPYLVELSNQ